MFFVDHFLYPWLISYYFVSEIIAKRGNSGRLVNVLCLKDIAKSWKWAFCNPRQQRERKHMVAIAKCTSTHCDMTRWYKTLIQIQCFSWINEEQNGPAHLKRQLISYCLESNCYCWHSKHNNMSLLSLSLSWLLFVRDTGNYLLVLSRVSKKTSRQKLRPLSAKKLGMFTSLTSL